METPPLLIARPASKHTSFSTPPPPPAVAVTAPRRMVEGRERVTLNTAYVRALERAGLVPLAVPTILAPERAAAALQGVRGLVLTGGADGWPARYRTPPHQTPRA